MSDPIRRRLLAAGTLVTARTLAAGSVLAVPAAALAADPWPSRPIRVVVPFPPGGPVDLVGRAIAQKLSESLGVQAVVDNRAGAGGILGAEIAARSAPDGYTVFVCAIHHSVLPGLRPKLPYDIEKDFDPISFGATFPIILVANPQLPVKSVQELIAYAKAHPGKVAYGSAGNGGGTHLAGELFSSMAGVELLHVPYKGSAPAMTDVLGNTVQLMFADAPTALAQIRAGKVRALAVGSPKRSALAPELPTMIEAGLAGYEAYSWAGVVVPAGTPRPIVQRLNAEVVKALSDPDVKARLLQAGAEAGPTTPEQFAAMLKDEIGKWGRIIKARNIQAD